MSDDLRERALKLLSDVDQQIAALEELTIAASTDEIMQEASALCIESIEEKAMYSGLLIRRSQVRILPGALQRRDQDSFTLRSRRALAITETLLKLIAAAAIMGFKSAEVPKIGTSTPAATGTPSRL